MQRRPLPRDEDSPQKSWWSQRKLEFTIGLALLLMIVALVIVIPGAFTFLRILLGSLAAFILVGGEWLIRALIWFFLGLFLLVVTFLGPFFFTFISFIKINEKDEKVDPGNEIGIGLKLFYLFLFDVVVVLMIAIWVPMSVKFTPFYWLHPGMYTGLMDLLHLNAFDTYFAPGWAIYGIIVAWVGALLVWKKTWSEFVEE